MRVLAACVLALGLVASPAMAAGKAGGGDKPATTETANTANTTAKASDPAPVASKNDAPVQPAEATMESEVQQLRETLESQARQMQEQSELLKEQQVQMEKLEAELASSGISRGNAVPSPEAVPAVASSSAIAPAEAVPTAAVNSAVTANAPNQAPAADQPVAIRYKGITMTPGGFMAAETVWRQKALGSDVNTAFTSAPFNGQPQAHTSEFNASGRQSRIAMLVEGKLSKVKIGGYYEMDFLSAGVTSNNNQSNSYTMRQRQFWGQAAFNNGWTFTGGQMWSLLTETGHGLDNRTETLPQTIDAQYHVGFSWARQYGFRVVKNFNNKVWLGLSAEESQATATVHGNFTATSGGSTVCVTTACTGSTGTTVINPTTFNNFLLGVYGTSGGLYNPLGSYAFNPAPDLVFKAAFEPGFGHYEIFGLLSEFRDRAFPCVQTPTAAGCGGSAASAAGAFNNLSNGGGAGANARWALLNKKVDLAIHFFGGSGIGRYGSTNLPDATTRLDGTLALLRNYQGLGTLQFHPTPKLDINLNSGVEYSDRAGYIKSGTVANEGYGAPGLSNSGCWTETLPISAPSTSSNTGVPTGVGGSNGFIPGALGSCTGDTRNVIEGSIGFWYRFYRGPMGTVQWGAQYANYVRNTWRGVGGTGIAASGQPHSDENMFFTSFRYYLP